MTPKLLSDYQDELGLIGQRKVRNGVIWHEGGDSAQRTGFIAIAHAFTSPTKARTDFLARMYHHEVTSGTIVRHPDPSQWYSNPATCSRDQITPIIIACGFLDCKNLLKRILFAHIKRFGFYQNWREANGKFKIADFASPEHWGFYIRSFNLWLLYPLLLIGDLFSLAGSIYKVYPYSRTPKNVDDLNRIASLIQSHFILPTPISRLSLAVYKKRHSYIEGLSGPAYSLKRYFSGPEDPPIDLEYSYLIKLLFD